MEARMVPETVEAPARTVTSTERMLSVKATYALSEAGRKALLLAGGDGRAVQEVTIEVPPNRLHLVSVDEHGGARLKLQPRYTKDARQQLLRIDAPPVYDAPPSTEGLLKAAAQNHESAQTYESERLAARTHRREAERDLRLHVAQAFLSDRTRRAIVHPAPSPKRCYVAADGGRRLFFDVDKDEGIARDLPPEAHRRFRADLAARVERNRQQRAAELAVHEEKKRFVADWIAAHGTPEQQTRQSSGVLPMEEAIGAITEDAFDALRDYPPYGRDGVARFQEHLRQRPGHANAIVAASDVLISSSLAAKATASQWALVQEIQRAIPDATVAIRMRKITWKNDPQIPPLQIFSVAVRRKVGPLTLRYECDSPGC